MIEIEKLNFKTYEDETGIGLQHADLTGKIVKYYYEELDKAILENMPLDLLLKLSDTCLKELKRREND